MKLGLEVEKKWGHQGSKNLQSLISNFLVHPVLGGVQCRCSVKSIITNIILGNPLVRICCKSCSADMSIFERYTALECRCGPQKSRREQRTSGFSQSSFISPGFPKCNGCSSLTRTTSSSPLQFNANHKQTRGSKTEKLTWRSSIKRTAVKDIRLSKFEKDFQGLYVSRLDNCCRNSQTTKQSKSSLRTAMHREKSLTLSYN